DLERGDALPVTAVDVRGEDRGVAGVVGVDARNGDERRGGGLRAGRGGDGGTGGGGGDRGGGGGAADGRGGGHGRLLPARAPCRVQPLDHHTFGGAPLGPL